MIRGALQHFPGIGPRLARRLDQAGIRDWDGLLRVADTLPISAAVKERLIHEIFRCEQARVEQDAGTLIRALARPDHWRILAHFFDRASFFDIETTGLEGDAQVTLAACLHRGHLHWFVRGENLDGFLDLLDEVDLLVSFNGEAFDVPRIERAFHIPRLPCPHLDLRWICHHEGLRGGLKAIEAMLGIRRPEDMQGVGGAEAELLWRLWERDVNRKARRALERYCGADVLALRMVAEKILETKKCRASAPSSGNAWAALPGPECPRPPGDGAPPPPAVAPPAETDLQRRLERRRRQARETGRG